MDTKNPLNVFKGPDSLIKYFNPDEQPPLPLVELPEKLNPFRRHGVRIYAKMLTALPAQNVKALPALNMLLNDPSVADKSIVEASSGSTVTSLGITARVLYDNDNTTAFCTNKAELSRLRQLQFFGIKVKLYGGPGHTEITDSRGIIEFARRLGRLDNKIANLAQYDNEHNWKSHFRWTGPQLWKQLPEINIFSMGMGSTGCVTGTGMYLKSQKQSVKILGVCNVETDLVPGPRELPMHESSPFPWKEVVDFTESVGSVESYRQSMKLCREGLIAGPSSGLALQGLFNFLQKAKDNGILSQYSEESTGEISCVFVCCDLPHKYLDSYFEKLPLEEFHPMVNEELLKIDQHIYSLRWEIDPRAIHRPMPSIIDEIKKAFLGKGPEIERKGSLDSTHLPSVNFLDLRSRPDFELSHVTGAYSSPLPNLAAKTKSPFDFEDVEALIDQWKELNLLIESPAASQWLSTIKHPLVVICYNGDTSRLLTAILRARGVEAYSFSNGMPGLLKYLDDQS